MMIRSVLILATIAVAGSLCAQTVNWSMQTPANPSPDYVLPTAKDVNVLELSLNTNGSGVELNSLEVINSRPAPNMSDNLSNVIEAKLWRLTGSGATLVDTRTKAIQDPNLPTSSVTQAFKFSGLTESIGNSASPCRLRVTFSLGNQSQNGDEYSVFVQNSFIVTSVGSASGPAGGVALGAKHTVYDLELAIADPLQEATEGFDYQFAATPKGGSGPYTVDASGLPTGWTYYTNQVNANGQYLTQGTTTFSMSVTDSTGITVTETRSLVVNPPLKITSPATLPNAPHGTPYAYQFSSSGGTFVTTGAPNWGLVIGTQQLPSGWSIDSNGVLNIQPAGLITGSYNFIVTCGDDWDQVADTFSLTVDPAPVAINTTSLPSGTSQNPYSFTLTASGGIGSYSWQAVGALPTGWTLSAAGILSAAAPDVVVGTYSITVQVSDSQTPPLTDSKTFSLDVVATGSPLMVSTGTVGPFQQGVNRTTALYAQGGNPPYTWSSPNLPQGFSLSATGDLDTGSTLLTAGSYSIDVTVEDAVQVTDTRTISFDVNPAPAPVIQPGALPDGEEGQAWTTTLTASGSVPGYTWALVSGTLPPGISGLPAGGTPVQGGSTLDLTGTPTTSGIFNFSVEVADSLGNQAGQAFTVRIAAPQLATGNGGPGGNGGGCVAGGGAGFGVLLFAPLLALLRRRKRK